MGERSLPNGPARRHRRALSRRDVVKGTLAAAAAFSGRTVLADQPPGAPNARAAPAPVHGVWRVDPKNVVEGYRRHGLAASSDRELTLQIGDIVANPGTDWTSFTLHAPLELMARAGLLSLVAPADRELARMQMVASGAAYRAGVERLPDPPSVGSFPDLATATRSFRGIFASADEAALEAVVVQIARQFGLSSLVQALTPALLPTLTSASHAHIGLWLLMRHGAAGDTRDASLLRAAARKLAAAPNSRLASFSGMDVFGGKPFGQSPAEIERTIFERLVDPPKGERPRTRGIKGLMNAGEATGNADRYFGALIRHDLTDAQMDAAFRAVMRVSAHAMLQDDERQAKFGWSHCFTLPQAACGLSSLNIDRKLGLATTLVWITAYRTVLSRKALDFGHVPEPVEASLHEALHSGPDVAARRFWHADPGEITAMRGLLASEAAVRNDQHLVKYTRACFDMCGFDPEGWRLYLASAAKLCGLWIAETPREKIRDRFLDGRATPG